MQNPQDLIVHWLARGNPSHRELLKRCSIQAESNGALTIDCPLSEWDQLLTYSQELGWLAAGGLVTTINLAVGGEIQHQFAPADAQSYPITASTQVDIFGLELSSQQVVGSGSAIAVVEMNTNLGVFCTRRINEISRIPDERWREHDMKAFHIPEEYDRLMDALATHQRITDFEYRALTGEREPYWQRVNAYLGRLGTRQVRVVEVADYRLL